MPGSPPAPLLSVFLRMAIQNDTGDVFMRLDRCVDGEGQRVVCVPECAHRRLIPPHASQRPPTHQKKPAGKVANFPTGSCLLWRLKVRCSAD